MNEIRIFEVTLKGNAIFRPAAGEHFTCKSHREPIIGEVWAAGTDHYCTACASASDRAIFNWSELNIEGRTQFTIVGIQSEISY